MHLPQQKTTKYALAEDTERYSVVCFYATQPEVCRAWAGEEEESSSGIRLKPVWFRPPKAPTTTIVRGRNRFDTHRRVVPQRCWGQRLTVVGDLVVAHVQVRDGRIPDEPGHEHPHEVVVDQIALAQPRPPRKGRKTQTTSGGGQTKRASTRHGGARIRGKRSLVAFFFLLSGERTNKARAHFQQR